MKGLCGFIFIELIVVMVIVVLFVGIVVLCYFVLLDCVKVSSLCLLLVVMCDVLDKYVVDKGCYFDLLEQLVQDCYLCVVLEDLLIGLVISWVMLLFLLDVDMVGQVVDVCSGVVGWVFDGSLYVDWQLVVWWWFYLFLVVFCVGFGWCGVGGIW